MKKISKIIFVFLFILAGKAFSQNENKIIFPEGYKVKYDLRETLNYINSLLSEPEFYPLYSLEHQLGYLILTKKYCEEVDSSIKYPLYTSEEIGYCNEDKTNVKLISKERIIIDSLFNKGEESLDNKFNLEFNKNYNYFTLKGKNLSKPVEWWNINEAEYWNKQEYRDEGWYYSGDKRYNANLFSSYDYNLNRFGDLRVNSHFYSSVHIFLDNMTPEKQQKLYNSLCYLFKLLYLNPSLRELNNDDPFAR